MVAGAIIVLAVQTTAAAHRDAWGDGNTKTAQDTLRDD